MGFFRPGTAARCGGRSRKAAGGLTPAWNYGVPVEFII
jgi:hypothetical protein